MASIILGKTDLKILQVLQEDDRLTNVEPSEQIVLLPSPYLRHLKQLEDTGIIHKYAALLSPVVVELGLQAFIRISISKAKVVREELSATVQTWPGVLSCFALADETGYLLRAFFTGANTFSHFVLDTLLSHGDVRDAQSSFVLKEIRNTTALPLTHLQRDQGPLS